MKQMQGSIESEQAHQASEWVDAVWALANIRIASLTPVG